MIDKKGEKDFEFEFYMHICGFAYIKFNKFNWNLEKDFEFEFYMHTYVFAYIKFNWYLIGI